MFWVFKFQTLYSTEKDVNPHQNAFGVKSVANLIKGTTIQNYDSKVVLHRYSQFSWSLVVNYNCNYLQGSPQRRFKTV